MNLTEHAKQTIRMQCAIESFHARSPECCTFEDMVNLIHEHNGAGKAEIRRALFESKLDIFDAFTWTRHR